MLTGGNKASWPDLQCNRYCNALLLAINTLIHKHTKNADSDATSISTDVGTSHAGLIPRLTPCSGNEILKSWYDSRIVHRRP